ncbi:uncharacterized protein [Periplaneta americana]
MGDNSKLDAADGQKLTDIIESTKPLIDTQKELANNLNEISDTGTAIFGDWNDLAKKIQDGTATKQEIQDGINGINGVITHVNDVMSKLAALISSVLKKTGQYSELTEKMAQQLLTE